MGTWESNLQGFYEDAAKLNDKYENEVAYLRDIIKRANEALESDDGDCTWLTGNILAEVYQVDKSDNE